MKPQTCNGVVVFVLAWFTAATALVALAFQR